VVAVAIIAVVAGIWRRDVVYLLGAQQAVDLGLDIDREDLAVLEPPSLRARNTQQQRQQQRMRSESSVSARARAHRHAVVTFRTHEDE
jgi:hypothetical protein